MSHIIESEPSSFEEASNQQVWRDAMIEENQSIIRNNVREYWKYKAMFVARGFSQKEGIGYDETFALVAQYTLIRTIITIAAFRG